MEGSSSLEEAGLGAISMCGVVCVYICVSVGGDVDMMKKAEGRRRWSSIAVSDFFPLLLLFVLFHSKPKSAIFTHAGMLLHMI